MSVEEAAQEVRRILRQNDVEETLHYLSTVTRSIEANQHDLRAAIGNSYRDLLAACDGVVGMEKDCADILTIESALETRLTRQRTSAERTQNKTSTGVAAAGIRIGSSSTAPILPPQWFAKRQRRHKPHVSAADLGKDEKAANSSGAGGEPGTGGRSASSKTAGADSAQKAAKANVGNPLKLPTVALPLPLFSVVDAASAVKQHKKGTTTNPSSVVPSFQASAVEELRMALDDELQTLHLQYMAINNAAAKSSDSCADRDMTRVFATLASMPCPHLRSNHVTSRAAQKDGQSRSDEHQQQQHHSQRQPSRDASQSISFLDVLPLREMAGRLSAVQTALKKVKSETCADANDSTKRRAAKVPTWVLSFQRRATTLETRLVKLLLVRLRRAADGYARVVEQRAQAELHARRLSQQAQETARASPGTTSAKTASAADGPGDGTEREVAEVRQRLSALAAAESQCVLYMTILLAECHGALRALQESPTLVGALVACAPGVDVARAQPPRQQQPSTNLKNNNNNNNLADSDSAHGEVLDVASLEKSADPLFDLAALRTRDVLSQLLQNCNDATSNTTTEGSHADAVTTSMQLLLALVNALLLREAQVSAARWSVLGVAAAMATTTATATLTSVSGESFADARGDAQRSRMHDGGSTDDHRRSAGMDSTAAKAPRAPRRRTFANASFLSSLGLPSFVGGAAGNVSAASVAANWGAPTSNTAWALRCFSGLTFLLRSLADYTDLVAASHTARYGTQSEFFPEEVDVVNVVHQAWSRITSEVEGTRQEGEDTAWGTLTPVGQSHGERGQGAARTLEELLAWRLKQRGGGSGGGVWNGMTGVSSTEGADGTPYKRNGSPSYANSPLGNPAGAGGYSRGSPSSAAYTSPFNRESSATPFTAAAGGETTPYKQMNALTDSPANAAAAGGVGKTPSTNARAYIETLRVSLPMVVELNTARTAPASRIFTRTLENGLPAAPSTHHSAGMGFAAQSVLQPLEALAHRVLAPLVSSLVVILARDPVAIADFGDLAVEHAAGRPSSAATKASPMSPNNFPPAVSLHRLLCGDDRSAATSAHVLNVTVVGQTWSQLNAQQWWERTCQSALHDALQRCFTVALRAVHFVEHCLLHGLIFSALPAEGDNKEGEEEEDAASKVQQAVMKGEEKEVEEQGKVSSAPSKPSREVTLASVRRTWRLLCSTLQRHALDNFRGRDSGGSSIDTASTTADGDAEFVNPVHRKGAAAAEHCLEDSQKVKIGGASRQSAPQASLSTLSLSSAATGIDWNRFRSSLSSHASAASRERDSVGRQFSSAVKAASQQARGGDGLFREEGLEWGLSALLATHLPPSFCSAAGTNTAQKSGEALGNTTITTAQQQQELMQVLSGFNALLFPLSRCSSPSPKGDAAHARGEMNGHAVELLHRCLHTLVTAVKAFSSVSLSNNNRNDGTTGFASFETRVVGWLSEALQRVEAALTEVASSSPSPAPNKPASSAPASTSVVVRSYELSLVLRSYRDALLLLRTTRDAGAAAEVQRLQTHAEELYEQANKPWQTLLVTYYGCALRQLYRDQLGVDASGQTRLGHLVGLCSSASWIRANVSVRGAPPSPLSASTTAGVGMETTTTMTSSNIGSGTVHGVAYPALPTPALTQLTQRTLRLLHQVLYGRLTVYDRLSSANISSDAAGMDKTGNDSPFTDEHAAQTDGLCNTGGVPQELLEASARQRVLDQLARTTADIFEQELQPLLMSTVSAAHSGSGTHASADADNVRLQWFLDVLFTSCIWCPLSSDGSQSNTSSSSRQVKDSRLEDSLGSLGSSAFAVSLFSSSATGSSALSSLGEGGGGGGGGGMRLPVDAAVVVPPGPLQSVAARLQDVCDPVRWRSAVPLILAAYRHYLSSSAALWVICPSASDADHNTTTVASRADTQALVQGSARAAREVVTVSTVAAMKPFVALSTPTTGGSTPTSAAAAGAGAAAGTSSARLLQPKEHVDRLALLPIAASSAAAAAVVSMSNSGNSSAISAGAGSALTMNGGGFLGGAPAAFTMAVPTAAALNPYPQTSASSVGGGGAAGGVSGGYRGAVTGALNGAMFYDGATGSGVGSGFVAGDGASSALRGTTIAGAGASSAAAAASSLWGTTQRGWNQLWGSS